jgi:hypothetical protein
MWMAVGLLGYALLPWYASTTISSPSPGCLTAILCPGCGAGSVPESSGTKALVRTDRSCADRTDIAARSGQAGFRLRQHSDRHRSRRSCLVRWLQGFGIGVRGWSWQWARRGTAADHHAALRHRPGADPAVRPRPASSPVPRRSFAVRHPAAALALRLHRRADRAGAAFTPIAFLVLIGVVEGISPSWRKPRRRCAPGRWQTPSAPSPGR